MHHHHHGHSHHHHDTSDDRLAWAFFLNLAFTIIEFIGGWLTNSTAIMADAVHDLGDSLSIGSAWVLNKLGKKTATEQFTYGFRRLSLLGALINSFVLIFGSIWILTESIPRLFNPVMPEVGGVLALAILGVVVNGYAAFRLSKGDTLNERVLNWHLLEDVLGWVAVLIVAIVLHFVDLPILDPILSIVFTLFILFNVIKNFWIVGKLFTQASPDTLLQEKIKNALLSLEEVETIHHHHLWSLDGESHVLSSHIVLKPIVLDSENYLEIKQRIDKVLSDFSLSHTTIEIEFSHEVCRDSKKDLHHHSEHEDCHKDHKH